MRSRDDQSVAIVDRIDIEDGNNVLVFEEDLSRNLSGHDLTENTIAHSSLHKR